MVKYNPYKSCLFQKRGVHVRIIADPGMAYVEGSQISSLQAKNIPVLLGNTGMMMHNKFALIDCLSENDNSIKNGLVITGSFNWTWSAVVKNFENVIITNEENIVDSYVKEYNRLWCLFT